MTIDNELIDNLLKGYKKPEDLIGKHGLLKQLTKRLLERAMAAEMTEHVGYEKHEAAGGWQRQFAERQFGENDQGDIWDAADRGCRETGTGRSSRRS